MLSDFELIIHEFPENEDIIIHPISDVHLGALEHNEKEWQKFCDNLLQEKNAYITLGGDLLDWGLKNSVTNVYTQKYSPSQAVRVLAEMLRPLAPRILCGVPGNHELRSKREIDYCPIYDTMCKLDIEHLYRENMAVMKIQIGNVKGNGTKNPTYIISVVHGSGGGSTTGATVNRNERFGYVLDGCDVLIVGHSHKPSVTQPSKIKIDPYNNKVSFKPFKVVSSTSWLDYGGYAAQKMLLPASLAPQTIRLCGNRKHIEVTM